MIVLGVGIAICGAILVAKGDPYLANVLWCVSNPIFLVHNLRIGEVEQAFRDLIFLSIAVFGIWNLRKCKDESIVN